MTHEVVTVSVLGVAVFVIQMLQWGAAGYLTFRCLGGSDERWLRGALALFAAIVLFDHFVFGVLVAILDLQIHNEAIVEHFNIRSANDFATLAPANVLWTLAEAIIGFRSAQWAHGRFQKDPSR